VALGSDFHIKACGLRVERGNPPDEVFVEHRVCGVFEAASAFAGRQEQNAVQNLRLRDARRVKAGGRPPGNPVNHGLRRLETHQL
jgi:hypothetical protein